MAADTPRKNNLIHLDSPTEYPRALLFKTSGWAASESEILSIFVGDKEMTLSHRADVNEAHSTHAFTTGFSGIARESDINNQALTITLKTASGDTTQDFILGEDTILSLSKHEKLAKLHAAFPNEDPELLIKDSQTLEVNDADHSKFKLLPSILKCPVCQSVGISQNQSAWSCSQGHSVDLIDNAFIYLDSDQRLKHNIKNNQNVASRAQDPLAVALIGKFKDGLILDCGSGLPFQNYKNVINFDIEKFTNTDVIGVGEELPFKDQSFDAVFSFSVLEHVKDPFKCASEIERILKPNGIIYSSVPFLIPVHGYPHHYYNMTQQGLANLFSNEITIVADGVPISGHPLFTLNSVANIWHSNLDKVDQEAFENLTLREIMDDPAKLIKLGHCAKLPQDIQSIISCTNMILATKNASKH